MESEKKAGGRRPGAGRKTKVEEGWARKVCINAIINKFGSIEAGVEAILNGPASFDERLRLFIWQHVLGVPETVQKVKLSDSKGDQLKDGILGGGKIIVEVVRTEHNKSVSVDDITKGTNDDSSRLSNIQ